MKRNLRLRKAAAVFLAGILLGQTAVTAVELPQEESLLFEQVEDDAVTASLIHEEEISAMQETEIYADTDVVRVSIVLEGAGTIDQGYSAYAIAENDDAMEYRQMVMEEQISVQRTIERRIGQALDVEWNLTLIANVISANVEYGQIETIRQIDGVEEVLLEEIYYPDVFSEDASAEPNMIFASDMIHLRETWADGYTGAGRRIAVVDTGLDTDHQSVSEEAYEYALSLNAESKEMDYEEYIQSLNLLDTVEIEGVLTRLNAYSRGGNDVEKLYVSSKIPYGFSYSTSGYDVTHDNDNAGNHGSHVAGIAAANRFVEKNGEMVDALETVMTAGAAPDAQILVMDVFGDMGAASGDILAAVEDAILLGADTVNLSLGTSAPGFSSANSLGGFLEKLKNSHTVATISAGNSFDWAYLSKPGNLYADDVNTFTAGEPGSGTHALTVASANNTGKIASGSLTVGGSLIEYSETFSYSSNPKNTPLVDMDTTEDGEGTDYEYILFDHYSYADSYEGYEELVEGKIVLCSRGDNSFSDKANNAMQAGAIAVIIYNNVAGSINMDLSEFRYEAPCVFITKDNGEKFRKAGTETEGPDGETYYTGTLTISGGKTKIPGVEGAAYEMSDFSSWGITGDLTLKPELTAPGGYIYSIDGGHKEATDCYTTMSGTSMAAPQIAGIGALVQGVIAEKGYHASFANSDRGLTQSILMSTAEPIRDAEGNYYPVIQQGAGLVNAEAAVNADSYIKMDKKATVSYDDGKVKAELGDDPDREGEYSFSFTLNNLDGQERTYDLSADVFSQSWYEALARTGENNDLPYKTYYMDRSTEALDAETRFTVSGTTADSVTVPAGGSVKVTAAITLTEDAKETLDAYFKNGTYLQAYVFVSGRADGEGVVGTRHSIPVLAFYGNWTDPSMYYGTSSLEGQFLMNYSTPSTTDNTRWPYFEWVDAWQGEVIPTYNHFKITTPNGTFMLGGNPLVPDKVYMPERNAVSGDIQSVYWEVWLARNAVQLQARLVDANTKRSYGAFLENGEFVAAYLNNTDSGMGGYGRTLGLTQIPEDGAELEFIVRALPEYYSDGKMGEDSDYGEGAYVRAYAVVDGTLPKAVDMKLNMQEKQLCVTAKDNNYVAAVVLYNEYGDKVLSFDGSKETIEAGESAEYFLDLSRASGKEYHVQVFDYAGNMATYRVIIKDGIMNYAGAMLAYDRDKNEWVQVDKHKPNLGFTGVSEGIYNAAVSVGDTIFAVTDKNKLYSISVNDLSDGTLVKSLAMSVTDLAYNPADSMLYGVTEDNYLLKIDPQTGANDKVGFLPLITNTLACDETGTFYCGKYGTGEIYAFTLESVESGISGQYDFNGDGTVSAPDSQILLDRVVGNTESIENSEYTDVDGDGDTDTHDVYTLQQMIGYYPERIAVVEGIECRYMQAMEIDPNNGTLYWASYFTDYMTTDTIGFSILYEIDTDSGEVTKHYDYWDQLTALVILDKDSSRFFPPVNGIKNLELSETAALLAVGGEIELEAAIQPWNTTDRDVLWSSSDETVAVVDGNGTVTAISEGVCEIHAVSAAEASFRASCTVTVSSTVVPEQPLETSERSTVSVTDNAAKQIYLAEQEEAVTVDLILYAEEETTNGLQTISVDSDLLELRGVCCDGLTSYRTEGDRTVLGFVTAGAAAEGEPLAALTFRVKEGGMEAELLIRELERNNLHMDIETARSLQGHIWSGWVLADAAVCGEDGKETRICADCQKTEFRTVPATGDHDWGDWKVILEATEAEEGERIRTCTVCGEVDTDAIHRTGRHIWGEWTILREATCGTDGEKNSVCVDCGETLTLAIPAAGAHIWGSWTEDAENNERTRNCNICGESQTKVITHGREGTVVEETFNFFAIGKHLIRDVQITGATVNRVTLLETEPEEGEQDRLHYLVELSSDANDTDRVHAKFRVSEYTVSGIGSAFVDKKVGSVQFDADVTDYDIDISSGTGSMEAWSYWNGSTCAAIQLEFIIGEEPGSYMAPYVYYSYDEYMQNLAVWDAEVVKETTFVSAPVDYNTRESTVTSYIWLDSSTPDDAKVGIQLLRAGSALELPEGWNSDGGYVQLEDGEAVVTGIAVRGAGAGMGAFRRHYVFYIKNHSMSLAPDLLQGSEVELEAEIGIPFSLDFRNYFADGNGDLLTYTLSVDGAEAVPYVNQKYRYTPRTAGPRVLTVTANDGVLPSEICTITITPVEGHVWSEWYVSEEERCTAEGEETRVCLSCGASEHRTLPCIGEHTWGEWHKTINEDGSEIGTELRICLECGELESQMSSFRYGDVSGNGEIGIEDITLLARYLANWKVAINLAAADVNADGTVDLRDNILLRRYLADWDVALGKS